MFGSAAVGIQAMPERIALHPELFVAAGLAKAKVGQAVPVVAHGPAELFRHLRREKTAVLKEIFAHVVVAGHDVAQALFQAVHGFGDGQRQNFPDVGLGF